MLPVLLPARPSSERFFLAKTSASSFGRDWSRDISSCNIWLILSNCCVYADVDMIILLSIALPPFIRVFIVDMVFVEKIHIYRYMYGL